MIVKNTAGSQGKADALGCSCPTPHSPAGQSLTENYFGHPIAGFFFSSDFFIAIVEMPYLLNQHSKLGVLLSPERTIRIGKVAAICAIVFAVATLFDERVSRWAKTAFLSAASFFLW